jgi:hypothetical protein
MEPDEIETLAVQVAASLWLLQYASAVERAIEDREPGARDLSPGPGGDWADCPVGPAPEQFVKAAREILLGLPAGILAAGRTAYRDGSGEDDEQFAYRIACEILAVGMTLSDDCRLSWLRLPEAAPLRVLSAAIPRRDCAMEFHAYYNAESGKVES